MNNFTWFKFNMMMVGNLCIGLNVALLRISMLGTDPFTTLNLGVSDFLEIPFGLYQFIFNLLLFGIVLLYFRHSIGLGTIVNMVGIGFMSDFIVQGYDLFFIDLPALPIRILMVLIAMLMASLGVALYVTPNLGMAPYDALAFVIGKMSNNKISFSMARVITDVMCVAIGFSFGAVVGVTTIILAFFTGPFVEFFRKTVAEPMLKKETEKHVVPLVQ